MINTHFKSEQNQFLHLDTEVILSAPLYILLTICGRSLRKKKKGTMSCFLLYFSSDIDGIFLKASQLFTMCVSLLMLYRNNCKFMQSYTHKFFF